MKLLISIILIFYSCLNIGKPIESTKQNDFEIEFLFEKDGCKIYRFYDAGRYIYWSNCAGNMQYNFMHNPNITSRMQSFTNR